MLRAYGPGCDGKAIDADRQKIPSHATWIDLEEPTRAEEELVERCLEVAVPTPEEMAEIEPSSRLYSTNGVLYMTVSVLYGVEDNAPASAPMGFVLTDDRLVTVRYVTPKPVRAFADHVRREPELAADALTALCGMLDSLVDRLADELEKVGAEIEKISSHIFSPTVDARRIPVPRLTALLTRIGKTQLLLAKIRESETSTSRLLSFLSGTPRLRSRKAADAREHVASLAADASSLSNHSGFLADHLYFLLDAAVGLISIEQNAAMKLFSWAALVLLPPTLVGAIYGMNFDFMPELHWRLGYPFALALMLASAVLPLWYLKRRGWL
ncbi:MAG TPA: magnesium transporter CorA family protein [Sphingomicrobium sp.]|nr:magnesium transporter CorA family protein [Sphingomicrobium sp.]